MFRAEAIIDKFVEGMTVEEFLNIEAISDDEKAYSKLKDLYSDEFGKPPSGVSEFLFSETSAIR